MSDFDFDNIRRIDGSLLLVFRELLALGRATDVANRLGLSQSAISHSLKKLRDIFNDPLFIRRPHGLEPTQKALELGPRIEALIDLAMGILTEDEEFDPKRSQRLFSFAAPDFITSLIGPRLVAAFQSQAPQAAFASNSLYLGSALGAVLRGEDDLALGQFAKLPAGLIAEPLYKERYCVVARKDHPKISGSINMETYAKIGHVFVGRPAGAHNTDPAYNQEHLASTYGVIPGRDVVATTAYVTQWESALLMVATSDAIADCPLRLAERYAAPLNLQVVSPPYKTTSNIVYAVRRDNTSDPGVDWFLQQIRDATGNN